jgi:hypothetical protein
MENAASDGGRVACEERRSDRQSKRQEYVPYLRLSIVSPSMSSFAEERHPHGSFAPGSREVEADSELGSISRVEKTKPIRMCKHLEVRWLGG